MGLYATTSSLSLLLPNALSGNTTSSDTEAVATFSKHIDRAESDINAASARRYSLPFSTVPQNVRRLAEDLACYYFLRAATAQDGQIENKMLKTFQNAMDDLELLREGKLPLVMTDGSLLSQKTTQRFKSSTGNYTPIFGLDDPKNWDVDDDYIDDKESERL